MLEREQLARCGRSRSAPRRRRRACRTSGRAPARLRGSRPAAACSPCPGSARRGRARRPRSAARARARRGRRTARGRSRAAAAGSATVNSALPFARERAERQPVEAVVGREDARALRRGAAELERRLDRLGAGAREEHALEPRRRAREQRLREQAGQRGDAELHGAGRLELERLDERRADARVVAADVVHPEAAEQVEVAVAVGVEEVGAVGARPGAVEADRAQHAHELRVDRARPARRARRRASASSPFRSTAPTRRNVPPTRWRRGSRARGPRAARRAPSPCGGGARPRRGCRSRRAR